MKKTIIIVLFIISALSPIFTEEIIKIKPQIYNFGTISQGKIISTSVTINNQSDKELNINLHTTCGCMVAGKKKIILAPKDFKKVLVKLNSTGYEGFIVKEIIITTDNTNDSPLSFIMQGT